MGRIKATCIVSILALTFFAGDLQAGPADSYWPMWRGPLGSGVAPEGKPPLTWSETQNIRWKVPVPGKGTSSPIVMR